MVVCGQSQQHHAARAYITEGLVVSSRTKHHQLGFVSIHTRVLGPVCEILFLAKTHPRHNRETRRNKKEKFDNKMLAQVPLVAASDRLYFAYGSNLSPQQMAHRCPDSIFLGKATLRWWRWQVNERGVANVVPVPVAAPAEERSSSKRGRRHRSRSRSRGNNHDVDDGEDRYNEFSVEGLVYAISPADERKLDSYEGVSRDRYEKFEMQVDFEPVRGNVFARCTSASVARAVEGERDEGLARVVGAVERRARSWAEGEGDQLRRRRDQGPRDEVRHRGASVGPSFSPSSSSVAGGGLKKSILEMLGISTGKTGRARARAASPAPGRGGDRIVGVTSVVALVYASTVYVHDSDVKKRYVPRMERAMADAVALGVSRDFVEKQVAPLVCMARPSWRSSWRMSLAGGGEDGLEKEEGRREGDGARRRRSSTVQFDGLGSRGRRDSRRDSVVVDRHGDY